MIPLLHQSMKVLAIETSCDETALAVIESDTVGKTFSVLGSALYSQASKHAEYGGVYPNLAKREHQENLVPLTTKTLSEAGLLKTLQEKITIYDNFSDIKEENFRNNVRAFLAHTEKPDIDLIAVTYGPGLEPALWSGVSFANALSAVWNIPAVGVNHLEGHIISALLDTEDNVRFTMHDVAFPVLSLLISGGHTELVLMEEWFSYELVGRTKDDAVGEAYDKVARLLGLPYPGGPHIETYAAKLKPKTDTLKPFTLPRPMIHEQSCDFSFSGLKTAVRYMVEAIPSLSESDKENIAHEFQNAVRDVLVSKTKRALDETGARTLAVGGGVSANQNIREALHKLVVEEFPGIYFGYPEKSLTGDNAIMIGIAGLLRAHHKRIDTEKTLVARGSLSLT